MRRMIFFLLAGLLLLGLVVPAGAWFVSGDRSSHRALALSPDGGGQNVEQIAQVGGFTGAVAVSGSYLYVGEGPRLTVLDSSAQPDSPSFVGQTEALADTVLDVFVLGSYAYVALGEDGLAVIDVTTPGNPTLAGSYQMRREGFANRLVVSGSYAYVADAWDSRLRVIDVSDAANPTEVAALEMPGTVLNVEVSGDYAYVTMATWDNGQPAVNGGLRIVDISDPQNPQEVGIYETADNSLEVAVAGNYAYLAAEDDGLQVIDVTNPISPTLTSRFDEEWGAIGVLVAEPYAYVVSNYGAVEILDISQPDAPSHVNSFRMATASNLALANDYIYAAAGVLWMIDVSRPESVPAANFYGTSGYVEDVAIAGDYAYLGIGQGLNGLQVIDISNKANPTHLGTYNDSSYYRTFGIDVAGNYVYLASGGDGLKVIDVSEPDDPFLASSLNTLGDAKDVVVAGNYAYIASGNNHGLRVIDISTPSNPTEVGFLETEGYGFGVDVAGNYAYLADGGVDNSVRVIDVSDPTNPTQVGTFNITGAENIVVEGNYAYVAVGSGGLWVIDVSDPTNPTQAGISQDPALARDVTVVGNLTYVADDRHGLRVFDVKRLLDIDQVGVYESPGQAVGVKEADGYVYLASGTGGLTILQYAGAVPAPTNTPIASNTPIATSTPSGSATPTPTPGENGSYEPNDTCAESGTIETNGMLQAHTFHTSSDPDWLAFQGIAGTQYLVEALTPAGSLADVTLEVYDACDNSIDGQGNTFSPDVRLQFEAPQTGTYYLRVTNQLNTGGADAIYHLSVRALSDDATPGALILIAGYLKPNDPLQDNIHQVTDAVYSLFLANGYDNERIYYLATDPTLDPDNNPTTSDVDGLPNQQNIEFAITQWAQDKVASNRALTIYMISHGGIERVYLNGANEIMNPDQLDGWLEQLESQVDNLPVNIIVETCHAGSFIDLSQSISEPGRVVISSTGVFPLAYASQDGAVFSDTFIEALGQGMSLYSAFEAARGVAQTSHPDQTPWLDDTGDGIPNGRADGIEAQQRGFAFAGTFPEERWAPYIVKAEVVDVKDGEGVISAEVRDDQSVENVWAVIYKPSYQPPDSNNEELVEETLPTVTLLDSNGDGTYRAIYEGFDELGTYRIVVYATDEQNLQGEPKEIQVGSALYLPTIIR